MPISEKTAAEMMAGASELALKANSKLPGDYMQVMQRTADRHFLLRRWEVEGLVTPEIVSKVVQYSPQKQLQTHRLYHVKDGPTFDDKFAEATGSSPSEVLIANIALALQALGKV